jgi:hypothetical protein
MRERPGRRSPVLRRLAVTVVVSVSVVLAVGAVVPTRPPAAEFAARVDNPWFPLKPGTRYVYVGIKDDRPSRDVVTVSHEVKKIDGVPCAVVHDLLYVAGRLGERTTDWYSQDNRGNVWYLGEDTAELDRRGNVTTKEGSWQAGVGGARAGIFMPAHPAVGQTFRQEYYKGQAEDHFAVIGVYDTVVGPRGKNALLTREWTPLEPGVVDHKLYVRGTGLVLEQTIKGGSERNELVSVTRIR